MSIAAINYRETYFPVKDLTHIIGIPTYETLHVMHLELKTNSTSIHSNLGGGQFGHLGLVISPARYAMESNKQYDRQLRHDAHERTYKEQLRTFHETRNVEIALIQQIVSAVDGQYISPMKNRNTGQFTGTIYQIIVYLQNTYGKFHRDSSALSKKKSQNYTTTQLHPLILSSTKLKISSNTENSRATHTQPYKPSRRHTTLSTPRALSKMASRLGTGLLTHYKKRGSASRVIFEPLTKNLPRLETSHSARTGTTSKRI
jgi:hypothetical protein